MDYNPVKCGYVPDIRDTSKLSNAELTRGEKVIRFIEIHCVIPEGQLVNNKVRLDPFQKLFILSVYDNPHGTDTAILSIARKNAKTGIIAFIVLAHVAGPEAMQNARIISGAMSREQAAEVFNLASKCAMLSPTLAPLVKIVQSSKTITGLPMNVEYKAISADAHTAHGKSPVVAILDEVGQIRGQQSDFVDAITTAQAAYENPLLIYISTQAPTDGDFFSIQIDDAERQKPKHTVCHVYAADKDEDLLSESAWYAANPALGTFRSMKDMKKQAEKADRMPSFENTFRNLNLNQRVSTISPFVSASVWDSCSAQPELFEGREVYAGLDLSARKDLTSMVLVSKHPDGKIDVVPYFWTPAGTIHERSKEDRVPYDIWAQEGFIRTTKGATVDYGDVASDIADILTEVNIKGGNFDRWRIDVLKAAFERIGFDFPLLPFGQGFKDMGPAVDNLEAELLNGRLRHGDNPVLKMCAANSITSQDPSGARKFDKKRVSGRIDGIVALSMALAALINDTEQELNVDFDDLLVFKL